MRRVRQRAVQGALTLGMVAMTWFVGGAASVSAQAAAPQAPRGGGEASLVLPDLGQVQFLGIDGHTLLLGGLVVYGGDPGRGILLVPVGAAFLFAGVVLIGLRVVRA